MSKIADSSVALVVTSPPYFVGKEYEEALDNGLVPSSYADYLKMLEAVFAECVRKLEPGGRIAVNVANLGRKPYRSLAADVITILQDHLRLLLRGEIIWQKAHGAGGSCAWGSFQSAANPVLRDVTERVVVASKGRFDRAQTRRARERKDLPSEVTIFRDQFMESTLDLWDISPESANRVGHPAPFPVELPERLIQLYTYKDDLVLDPFIGSGTTAVAAIRTDRHFVGYDKEPGYVNRARIRVEEERQRFRSLSSTRSWPRVSLPAIPVAPADEDPQARAVREGQRAKEIAFVLLEQCAFSRIEVDRRFPGGVSVNFVAYDKKGQRWLFDVSGAFTSSRAGLLRTDTLWKAFGKAAVLKSAGLARYRLVFLTTNLPRKGSAGDEALRAGRGDLFHDALEMLSPLAQDRLKRYGRGKGYLRPLGELLATDQVR